MLIDLFVLLLFLLGPFSLGYFTGNLWPVELLRAALGPPPPRPPIEDLAHVLRKLLGAQDSAGEADLIAAVAELQRAASGPPPEAPLAIIAMHLGRLRELAERETIRLGGERETVPPVAAPELLEAERARLRGLVVALQGKEHDEGLGVHGGNGWSVGRVIHDRLLVPHLSIEQRHNLRGLLDALLQMEAYA